MATIAAPVPVEREFTVRSRSQLQFAVRRFVRNPLAMGGLVAFVVMVVAAVAVAAAAAVRLPGAERRGLGAAGHGRASVRHDTIGRDVLALTLRGIEWSMLMCGSSSSWRARSACWSARWPATPAGWSTTCSCGAVDITLTLPFLAVVLVLTAAFPSARSPVGVALLIALTSWMALARIVRAQFLSLREREYVEARERSAPPAGASCCGTRCPTRSARSRSG